MKTVQFSSTYSSNYRHFLNFAHKLTKSYEDAKDLVQEASIKGFQSIDQLDNHEKFKPWFFRVIYHTYISKYNKRKRRKELLDKYGHNQFYFFNKSKDINEGYEKLKSEDIMSTIQDLDDKYKNTFLMYTHGYSYKEISKTFEIPVGTVKSRINMARKKVKSSDTVNYAA